jgi:hypothetical protein
MMPSFAALHMKDLVTESYFEALISLGTTSEAFPSIIKCIPEMGQALKALFFQGVQSDFISIPGRNNHHLGQT